MPTRRNTILTIGEYRVGIDPGGHPEEANAIKHVTITHVPVCYAIKRAAADLIDMIDAIPINDSPNEVARQKALAMTLVVNAAMWAVKAVTNPPIGS